MSAHFRRLTYFFQKMTKNLVIVESPAKAKTINKYLGSDYLVMASIGHIKDLPMKELGVDVENNFEPTYEVIPDNKKRNNKKTVSDLKKAAKAADTIFLAADPDREGEAICQHLAEEIVPKRPAKAVFRVMFNEITKKAIQDAFKEPKISPPKPTITYEIVRDIEKALRIRTGDTDDSAL